MGVAGEIVWWEDGDSAMDRQIGGEGGGAGVKEKFVMKVQIIEIDHRE